MLDKHQHGPFHFDIDRPNLDWRIGEGVSNFLIARGSGHSLSIGKIIFQHLTDPASELSAAIDKFYTDIAIRRQTALSGQGEKDAG